KTRFDGEWQQKSSFDLKFKINGFGKSYYNSQLEILRCAWTDFAGNAVLSPMNDKLASSLSQLVPGDFERQTFSKDFLKNHFDGLCICDSTSNKKEIDIMSKLFFGFFSLQNGDWDIDDSEFERFLHGKIELDFENMNSNAEPELELEGTSRIRLMNLLRRNTLFLFLKTIEETTPERDDMKQTIWDATYFGQNSRTKRRIDFGRL